MLRAVAQGGGSAITLETNGVNNASQAILNLLNGTNVTITDGGGGAITIASTAGGRLDQITAATASATIASGNNTGIVWNWANTADSTVAFTFGETSAATGGTSTSGVPNQVLLKLTTLAASTQSPLSVYSRGTHVFSVSPSTAQILAAPGGLSPAYSFASSTNSGMSFGNNQVQFRAGGTVCLSTNGTATQVVSGTSTSPSMTDNSSAVTGLYWPSAGTVAFCDSTSAEIIRFVGGTANVRYVTHNSVTFANLPAAANGSVLYCSDCDAAPAIDSTCTSAGGKTGSMAARVNGAWKCYT